MTSNVTPFRNLRHVSLLWAAPDSAAEVAALHQRLFEAGWETKAIRELLDHPAATSLIAVAGNPKVLIGFVLGQLVSDEAEIVSLGVAPEWQRTGLGKMLVEGLIRASKRGEAKKLYLEVAEDNAAALKLYRSLDFVEVGRRKKYYRRSGGAAVDALQLCLDL